jgi:hypothetical protein
MRGAQADQAAQQRLAETHLPADRPLHGGLQQKQRPRGQDAGLRRGEQPVQGLCQRAALQF